MKIVFIQTGGTMDKDYPKSKKGWAFEFGEPAAKRILEKLDPSFEYELCTAFQKDSLEVTDKDRQELSELIHSKEADAYIITHGTDTLLETASFLQRRCSNKRIVLTGAMRPERFANSDAPINLGCAIGAVNLIPSGVYVTMHGILKPSTQISRDERSGKFY